MWSLADMDVKGIEMNSEDDKLLQNDAWYATLEKPCEELFPWGGTPTKLGRGVRPASQNPSAIYNNMTKICNNFFLPYLWPLYDLNKNLIHCTYRDVVYCRRVPKMLVQCRLIYKKIGSRERAFKVTNTRRLLESSLSLFDFVWLPNPIEQQSFNWVRLDFCSILFD